MLSPISVKKCAPPADGPEGGFPHFFSPLSKIGDNRVWRGVTLLKNWSRRGYPYFGHFLAILGISGENGVPDWSPRGCKPVEKTAHHPWWVISEVLPRVYLGSRHAGNAKYTLGKSSEMTHQG